MSGEVFSLTETVSWMEGLMATLDCYNWVLGEQLLSPSELFTGNIDKFGGQMKCTQVINVIVFGICHYQNDASI